MATYTSGEVVELLKPIDKGLSNIESKQKEFIDDYEDWRKTKDERDEKNQRALDELIKRSNAVPMFDANYGSLQYQVKAVIAESTQRIKSVRKDASANIEFKSITLGSNVIGGGQRSYVDPTHQPRQGTNFTDLISITQSKPPSNPCMTLLASSSFEAGVLQHLR